MHTRNFHYVFIRPFVFENNLLIKLDDFRDKTGQRSMAFLPHRCVNVMESEIVRCYKGNESGMELDSSDSLMNSMVSL